jgi:flagellar biosynthesis protein FlhF
MYSEELNQPELTMTAESLIDCKRRLFDTYGENYTITGKRTVLKGGFLGFGQKEYIEVRYVTRSRNEQTQKQKTISVRTGVESFQKNKEELLKTAGAAVSSTIQIASLSKKVEDLQKSLDTKLDMIASAASAGDRHPVIKKIEDLLSDNEFTYSYINRICDRLRSEFPLEQLDDFDVVQRSVVDWIGQSIKIVPKIPVKLPHVIIIVGPTGVGKTTTVAKMAANIILDAKAKSLPRPGVRMITIDRTRVGAEEQLRRYGEIMNITVDKAESAADVKQIFDEYHESLDSLIIDTSGYSPNDYENIGKMRAILNVPGLHPDVYLAVTASTKARDLITIMQNYEVFDYKSVIVTKCDETGQYGNVLSVLSERNKPISYITDGQQVPRHIERASVVKFLTNLTDFKIDRLHIDDTFPEEN